MTDFVFFSVTGQFESLVTDSTDTGGEPDIGPVSALVTFTPSAPIVEGVALTPMHTVILQPITGRIEDDGILKTLDSAPLYYVEGEVRHQNPGPDLRPVFVEGVPAYWVDLEGAHTANPPGVPVFGVRLVANTTALGPLSRLDYRVDFTHVVFDGANERHIPTFTFTAPTSDTVVDLASVARV